MLARLLPILGVTFIDILGFSILIPILPYFAEHFGASDLTVGVLFSTFAACQLAAGPFWGRLSDAVGRKRVLIVSQIGATAGWAMLGFAHDIGMVFAARVVEGVSGGNISVTQAYVADLVEERSRARAFTYVGAAFSAGFVFGPAIGGALLTRYGFAAPFFVAAALQVLTLVLTIAMLPESRAAREDAAAVGWHEILRSVRTRGVAAILGQTWIYSLALYGWFGVFALFLRAQLHLDAAQTSLLFAVYSAFSVALQLTIAGRIADALGDRKSSTVGLGLSVLAFAVAPFATSYVVLALAFALFSGGMTLARPGLTSILSRAVPEDRRGAVLGLSSSLDNLSGVLMPPISTGLLGAFGAPWSVLPSGIFSLLACAVGVAAQRGDRLVAPATAGD
ncbi:MAG: MFS transporter [bacterium]|nr:MFS transporter [bacterium]